MTSHTLRTGTTHGLRATVILAALAVPRLQAEAEIAFSNYVDRDTFAYIVQERKNFFASSVHPVRWATFCCPNVRGLRGLVAEGYGDGATRFKA